MDPIFSRLIDGSNVMHEGWQLFLSFSDYINIVLSKSECNDNKQISLWKNMFKKSFWGNGVIGAKKTWISDFFIWILKTTFI